ncbi:hypothetical protein WR25_16694 [Diploscapter pachys]|uniref:Uncharacterized protein n=1 Tax=Diploscapter pachys TaxID=2018661 RepID=A0A2A2LUL1_9BILA|nr:hypothetical protein WR25_16694 [Diploscapter pachys]
MRFRSTRHFIMLVCGVVLSIYAFVWLLTSASSSHVTVNKSSIPLEYQARCRFQEIAFEGEEAEVSAEYKLRGVAVVFRHGERSAMSQKPSFDCACFRDDDRRTFETLQQEINSDKFAEFVKVDPKFSGYPKTPHRSQCSPANMTAEGALMINRMSSFLRSKYQPARLFSGEHMDVKIVSSQYHRTFQSALSFIQAFFHKPSSFIPSLNLIASNFTFLCTSPACVCSQAKHWRSALYDSEHQAYFLSHGSKSLIESIQALKSLPAFENAMDPLALAINETFVHGEEMYAARDGLIARKLQSVEAYAVLYEVGKMLYYLQKQPHSKIIRIFSGHDTVLIPLARSLRIPYIEPPYYATRMVFEAYDQPESPLLVRLLYDGVDVTSHLSFCRDKLIDGLCPASALQNYVNNFIKNTLGVSSIAEVCKD